MALAASVFECFQLVLDLFIRSHGLSTTEAGLSMAIVLGLAGVFGTWLGGKCADVFGKRDKRHILSLPAFGMAIGAPILFRGYAMEDWRVAVAMLILPTILNSAYYGPAYACVQGLVRPQAPADGVGPRRQGSATSQSSHTGSMKRRSLFAASWRRSRI